MLQCLIPRPKGSDLGTSLHAVNHAVTFLPIQEYLQGATDPSLKREPMREQQEPGLPKTYDSVKVSQLDRTL